MRSLDSRDYHIRIFAWVSGHFSTTKENKKLNNTNYESKTTTDVETDTHSLRSSSFFFFFVLLLLLLLLLLPPLGLSVYFFLSLLPAWTKFYDGGVSFFTLFASKILTQLDSLYNSRVTHLHVEPHYNW